MDEAQALRVAAGVAGRVGQGSTFTCFGRYVCVTCPDDRHLPAFRPFRLPSHRRAHLQTNPTHRIRWWCWDCLRFDCQERPLKGGHGGRRPGAGAPRGNLNALSHGRRSQDHHLRRLLARVPADVRAELLPWLKATGVRTIKRRLAWLPKEDPRLLRFPTTTTTTHAGQSRRPTDENETPSNPALDALALRMTTWGFFGAAAFTRAHSPAAPVIAQVLDHFDQDGLEHVRSPGALLRSIVHEEIADRDGNRRRCPYCPWTSVNGREATS